MRIPTVDEIRALRLALRAYDERPVKRGDAKHDLSDIGDLIVSTGCRIGEPLALRWKSVDLDRGVVVISATVVRVAGQGLIVQDFPKSESSVRELADAFRAWVARKGNFGSHPRARMWGSATEHPAPTGHTLTTMTADLRCSVAYDLRRRCSCVGALLHRAQCDALRMVGFHRS